MKKFKLTTALILVLILSFSLSLAAACSGKKYTVTFDADGGTSVDSQTISDGKKATKPDDPTKNGLVFDNWYSDSAKTIVFNFDTAIKADTTIYAKWKGLPGAESNPYIITTNEQLKQLATDVNATKDFAKDKYYKLGNDIDLNDEEWTPIGVEYSKLFNGSFDGGGFVVKNFKITTAIGTGERYLGLFGINRGIIANLGVEKFNINVTLSLGNLYAGGLAGSNSMAIKNCYATGNIVAGSSNITTSVGGLVGDNSGTIENSYATGSASSDTAGSLSSSETSAKAHVGGLVGYNSGTIENSYAAGIISATGLSFASAGGLVGYKSSSGALTNCYATGSVHAGSFNSVYAGGLIGYKSGEAIANCHRYREQTITSRKGATNADATNTEGTPQSFAELSSGIFVASTLKCFE